VFYYSNSTPPRLQLALDPENQRCGRNHDQQFTHVDGWKQYHESINAQYDQHRSHSQLVQMIPYVVTVMSLITYAIVRKRQAAARQRRFQQASV
jgi:thioesterase domain-containing protein